MYITYIIIYYEIEHNDTEFHERIENLENYGGDLKDKHCWRIRAVLYTEPILQSKSQYYVDGWRRQKQWC